MSRARRLAGLAGAGLALAGCAVGPRYAKPATPSAGAGAFISASPQASSQPPPPAGWWRLYDDPVLDRLVPEALSENQDLKVAAANLAYAQALAGEARAGLLPSTDLSAGATYGRSTAANAAAASGVARNSWTYSAGFNAAYQVDLFGRLRRTIEAANANAEQVRAAEDAVRVTIAAQTAGAYANLCGYAEQADVARQSQDVAQQTYDLIVREREIGSASDFDVARAATTLEQAKAVAPTLEGERRAALFELAALLGKTPAEAPADAAACRVPPKIDRPLPVGDGTAMLRRRPDVREAERLLAADVARVGVAAADLYPTVTLGGSVSTAAGKVSALGAPSSVSWSLGPLITWSFPNVTVAEAHVREARATASGALASFNATVLTALKETEQTLTGYAAELDHHRALAGAVDKAQTAFDLAQVQYKVGSTSLLDLLTAETTLIDARQALAASDQALSNDQVAVFQALGGGWEDAPPVSAPKIPG
ncbi:MAG: TolC family protein [Caulobacteraceae bacterium]|nr:TolC family protein [Caulobacteraceae bacterium]